MLTDSEYVRRGITEFLPRWKANGCEPHWKASGEIGICGRSRGVGPAAMRVTWIHVRGHSGNRITKRCDSLAVTAARTAKRDAASGF